MEPDGLEVLVEAANDVEDERPIGHGLAEITKILRLALVEAAVVNNGELTLTEGPKVSVGVQGARRLVPKELGFDGKPDVAGGGAMLGDSVGEVVGDGAEEPSPHDVVHPDPLGGVGKGDVRQNMALQGIPPEGEEEGFAPPSVEGGSAVEAKRDEQPDGLHADRLGVKV
jgi:hypothetical protein